MAIRDYLRKLQRAGLWLNLFGLFVSLGTRVLDAQLSPRWLSLLPLTFGRSLGAYCWVLGFLLFAGSWIAESF